MITTTLSGLVLFAAQIEACRLAGWQPGTSTSLRENVQSRDEGHSTSMTSEQCRWDFNVMVAQRLGKEQR
jgi:hypothetical protein